MKKPIPLLARWITVLLLTLGLGAYALSRLNIEQDIVASLEKSRPKEAEIFHRLKGSGYFQDQIYIHLDDDDPIFYEQLEAALQKSGYHLTDALKPTLEDPTSLYALLPYLPPERRDHLLGESYRLDLAAQLQTWLSAPGGVSMLRLLARDPLLLSQEIPKLIQGPTVETKTPLLAKRDGDIDWEKTRELYAFLQSHDSRLTFLGGDFFALENYDAVHHDIMIASLLSTFLSLLVFRFFCRQWSLLIFLFFGTALSSVLALVFAEIWYGALYGLILAFASTFVSFNNESLVHLSGIDWNSTKRKSLIGVFSALGTTVIGFLVLLFSSSHLTRQLALLSLGSLFGFLAFLYIFRRELVGFRFRAIKLPVLSWSKPVLYTSLVLLGLAIALLPKPQIKTDLEEFRFASPYLQTQTDRFSREMQSFSLEKLYALPKASWAAAEVRGDIDTAIFQPMNLYRDSETMRAQSADTKLRLSTQLGLIIKELETAGVRLELDEKKFLSRAPLAEDDYLSLWQSLWPLPWNSGDYRLAFLKDTHQAPDAVAMHPKSFYEDILSDLTQDLGRLFLIGLGAMLLYLIPWQKRLDRIVMIFFPLLLSLLVLQIVFTLSGRSVTIVHIMGLALVISVALDYASVLVSSDHDPSEQGKVLLTGGLTLVAFGSLLLARHPVLKELAIIVFTGTLVSWLVALFTRLALPSPPISPEVKHEKS